MLRDTIYATRQLRKSPAFLIGATLTLALAIGANTAIYQALDAVMFRELPVRDPERLVRVQLLDNGKSFDFSYPLYREMALRQQVAEGMLASSDSPLRTAILRMGSFTRTVNAVLVTNNYFSVLGVSAQIGRVFTVRESDPVAVISDTFWSEELSRDPNVIGRQVFINKTAITIVGVARRGFSGEWPGNVPDLWLPMDLAPQLTATDWRYAPKSSWLTVIARLHRDVSPAQAQAALASLAERYQVRVEPANRGIPGLQERFVKPLLVLMAAAGMALLIACCNLANLMLSRAACRRQEMSIRMALGASRWRLIRQLLAEALLVSGLGAIAALVVAHWAGQALAVLAAQPPLDLDWRTLTFTGLVALTALGLFGLGQRSPQPGSPCASRGTDSEKC